jgi:hypothetical protein
VKKKKTLLMDDVNYDVSVREGLGVELAGWPHDIPMKRASSHGIETVRRIRDMLRTGAIVWTHLTKTQHNVLVEEHNKKRAESGGSLKKRAPRSDKGKTRAKTTRAGGSKKGGKKPSEHSEDEDEDEDGVEEEEDESEDESEDEEGEGNERSEDDESRPQPCMSQIMRTDTSAALAPGVGSELVAAFGVASQMAPDTSAQFTLDAAFLFPPSIPASHLDPPDIDWNQLQNDMQSLYPLPNPTSAVPDGGFLPLSVDGGFPPLALDAWPRLRLTASPIASETEGGALDPALTTSNGRAKRKAADGSTDAPSAKKARRNVENTEPRTDGMAPGAERRYPTREEDTQAVQRQREEAGQCYKCHHDGDNDDEEATQRQGQEARRGVSAGAPRRHNVLPAKPQLS